MKIRMIPVLFAVLFSVLCSFPGCSENNPRFVSPSGIEWLGPNYQPQPAESTQIQEMLIAHAVAAEVPAPDSTRITHWWKGDAVPQNAINRQSFGWASGSADDLIRVEYLTADGRSFNVRWIFLKWNDAGPYAIAMASSDDVPSEFR